MSQSVACQQGDSCAFKTDDVVVTLEVNKEPGMKGGLKLGCSAADALILQYYEEQDDGGWTECPASIKGTYMDNSR